MNRALAILLLLSLVFSNEVLGEYLLDRGNDLSFLDTSSEGESNEELKESAEDEEKVEGLSQDADFVDLKFHLLGDDEDFTYDNPALEITTPPPRA